MCEYAFMSRYGLWMFMTCFSLFDRFHNVCLYSISLLCLFTIGDQFDEPFGFSSSLPFHC